MDNLSKKDRQYTKYQKKVIKNYYDNKGTIKIQRLGELISDMYLETSEKKRELGWKRIEKTLQDLNVSPYQIECIMNEKSLEGLSKRVSDLF